MFKCIVQGHCWHVLTKKELCPKWSLYLKEFIGGCPKWSSTQVKFGGYSFVLRVAWWVLVHEVFFLSCELVGEVFFFFRWEFVEEMLSALWFGVASRSLLCVLVCWLRKWQCHLINVILLANEEPLMMVNPYDWLEYKYVIVGIKLTNNNKNRDKLIIKPKIN